MITLASIAVSPVGYLIIASGIIGLGFSFWNYYKMSSNKVENEKTEFTVSNMKEGVKTLINSRYKLLAIFAVVIGILLFFYGKYNDSISEFISISFIIGAASAATASYFSKHIATKTGNNVVNETKNSYKKGFVANFNSSVAIGLTNVSIFVLGAFVNFLVLSLLSKNGGIGENALDIFVGFAFGVGFVSVLTRLSGDLFNQSAEIAEDEVIEKNNNVTKTSMFNPASSMKIVGRLASNVGGISADVFDTLTMSVVAAILVGASMVSAEYNKTEMLVYLPLIIAGVGVLTSLVSSYFLRPGKQKNSEFAIKLSEGVAAGILLLSTFFAVYFLLPQEWVASRTTDNETITTTYHSLGIFWSAVLGIAASVGLGYISDSFSDPKRQAAKEIAGQSMKGVASNNLSTIRMSFISIGAPVLLTVAVGLSTFYLANFYGIAIAAVAFLGNIALQQSFSSFAAISETSATIASKSNLDNDTIKNATLLKEEGNIALSNFKMFLLVAASLSAVAMFSAFIELSDAHYINIAKPLMMSALAVGALIPVLLSYNTIGAVKRLRKRIVIESERQFNENMCLEDANLILLKYDGDLTFATEGEKESIHRAKTAIDNKKCVKESANMSFYEVLAPLGIAIAIPILLGVFGGAEILASLIAGFGVSSVMLATYGVMRGTLSESARHTVEAGFIYNGEIVEKDSSAYNASVLSETSSKVLKNVVAPTAMMLVKIAIIVSLVLIPLLNMKSDRSKSIHIEGLSKIECKSDFTENRA